MHRWIVNLWIVYDEHAQPDCTMNLKCLRIIVGIFSIQGLNNINWKHFSKSFTLEKQPEKEEQFHFLLYFNFLS